MNELSKTNEHKMIVRIISSIIALGISVPMIILGGWYVIGFSILLVGLATHEVLSLPGRKRYNLGISAFTYITVFCLVYWPFLKENINNPYETSLLTNFFSLERFFVSFIALIVYILVLFTFSFCWENFRIEDIFYLFTMVFLISTGFYSILFLRFFPVHQLQNTPSDLVNAVKDVPLSSIYNHVPNITTSFFFFFVLGGVFASDIGAYFVGVLFGKHPMNIRISPHKTWEGFIGGVLLSFLFSYGFVLISDYALGNTLLYGVIDIHNNPISSWLYLTLFAFIFPILDNVGGFLFSSMKRRYDQKDWGKIMPGHGGVLDRFDGALITSMAIAVLSYMISVNWSFAF